MKRDIRGLFKEADLVNNTLPDNHRTDFLEKLRANKAEKIKPKSKFVFYKIAASILLFVCLGYLVNTKFYTEDLAGTPLLVKQIETVEKQYLNEIDKEWQSFLALTTDDKLVRRFEEKLADLNENYIVISKAFKADANNILVIEDLIKNLKTRLQLLKDIQEHIKILNSKNITYETTI